LHRQLRLREREEEGYDDGDRSAGDACFVKPIDEAARDTPGARERYQDVTGRRRIDLFGLFGNVRASTCK
jgi:hypothetical protein